MSERHAAIVIITTEALAAVMHFPTGMTIRRVYQSPEDEFKNTAQILIEYPRLPLVREGAMPQEIDIYDIDKLSWGDDV